MADRKISDLTALTAPASGDYLPIVDISEAAAANKNKRITIEELFRGVPLGTAAAPSIAIEGDENTGIYSPGADQLAISTNGAGRLFVDSVGNIGANVSPFAYAANARNLQINAAGYSALTFGTTDGGTGEKYWRWIARTASPAKSLVLQTLDDAGGSEVTAYTIIRNGTAIDYQAWNTGGNERLRITSTGTVNIVGAGTAGSTQAVSFNGSAPVNSLVVDSSGRVGIGTSPSQALTVAVADTSQAVQLRGATGYLRIRPYQDATNGAIIDSTNAAESAYSPLTLTGSTLRLFGNNATGITVNTTGQVGIGTTSVSFDFQVDKDVNSLVTSYTRSYNAGSSAGGRVTAASNVGSLNMSAYSSTHSVWPNTCVISSDSAFTGGLVAIAGGANPLQFWTNSTERARIDSSGRLLVGTSTVVNTTYAGSGHFQVHSDGVAAAQVFTHRSTGSEYPAILELARSRGSLASPAAVIADDKVGACVFHGYDGANYIRLAAIDAAVDGTPGTNDMPGRLVFSTTADGASSPTERMRIYNDGRTEQWSSNVVTFGTSSSQAAGTSNYLYVGRYGATGNAGGTTCFFVFTNGDVRNTNNSYAGISDIKLKENIVDANSQWDDIKALQVRNYNFKEGQTHTQIGLVAQEVELVSPGLVSESPDRDEDGNDLGTVTKSVNYSVLYMKAVKALQEAMERIEQLEAKVATLEAA